MPARYQRLALWILITGACVVETQSQQPDYPRYRRLTPGQPTRVDIALLAPNTVSVLGGSVDNSPIEFMEEHDNVDLSDLEPNALADPTGALGEPAKEPEMLRQLYPDGNVHIERWVTEDSDGNLINHGNYKEFDGQGNLLRSGNFRMGELDGPWHQSLNLATTQSLIDTLDPGFRPPFKSEAIFSNGQLDGDWAVSDSAGKPVVIWQFVAGQRENASTWLNSRSQSVREINYVGGVPDGAASRVVPGSREPERFTYFKGQIVKSWTTWHDPDRRQYKKSEETVLMPGADELVSHDWWNSQVVSNPVTSSPSIRHGRYVAWHTNGTKSIEGEFQHGQPVGEFQWWYPSGQLQGKGVYQDGLMSGSWTWWYPNGMKLLQGNYASGEQVGTWSQWAVDGQLVLRENGSEFPYVKQDLIPETDFAEPEADRAPAVSAKQKRPQHPVRQSR
jgi:antitoxin component YwqK of YwqJK toxin-antitoxin module